MSTSPDPIFMKHAWTSYGLNPVLLQKDAYKQITGKPAGPIKEGKQIVSDQYAKDHTSETIKSIMLKAITNGIVFEAGGGSGRNTQFFIDKNCDIILVDGSKHFDLGLMLRLEKKLDPNSPSYPEIKEKLAKLEELRSQYYQELVTENVEGFKLVLDKMASEEVQSMIGQVAKNFSNVHYMLDDLSSFDIQQSIEKKELTKPLKLVSASYSITYLPPEKLKSFLDRTTKATEIGGLFIGSFFGTQDGFNTQLKRDYTFTSIDKLKEYFKENGYEILHQKESIGPQAYGKGRERIAHKLKIVAIKVFQKEQVSTASLV